METSTPTRSCSLGLAPEGLIRAGCACYTTEEEIDRLIDGVDEISKQSVSSAL